VLEGSSAMSRISRDPADLMAATIGADHQYPDGVVLYLGTMFAPTKDRNVAGEGFTHKTGDLVTIKSPKLGKLQNRVVSTREAEPWAFGTRALMTNLARRNLL
jgi:fumarylacetoacetate (FAA) hydrolase family protein